MHSADTCHCSAPELCGAFVGQGNGFLPTGGDLDFVQWSGLMTFSSLICEEINRASGAGSAVSFGACAGEQEQ